MPWSSSVFLKMELAISTLMIMESSCSESTTLRSLSLKVIASIFTGNDTKLTILLRRRYLLFTGDKTLPLAKPPVMVLMILLSASWVVSSFLSLGLLYLRPSSGFGFLGEYLSLSLNDGQGGESYYYFYMNFCRCLTFMRSSILSLSVVHSLVACLGCNDINTVWNNMLSVG